MKLLDFVCFDAVIPQLEASDRDGVIAELVSALADAGKIKQTDEIISAVVRGQSRPCLRR